MIEIRELMEDDLPEAHRLSVEVFGQDANDEKHSIEKWKKHLKENGTLIGAFDGDELVGFVFGYQRIPEELHSWLAGVRETHRRQGVMRSLNARQEALARAHGFKAVTVNTYQDLFPGMYQFLLQDGYVITGQSGSIPLKTHFRKDLR
jgi:predicted GNAT superfamily acetyltransferase